MDTDAWTILADLLEMAGAEFSNHGSNDYFIRNTPANRLLMEDMNRRNCPPNGEDGWELSLSPDGTQIDVMDWQLFGYFEDVAREYSNLQKLD